MKMKTVPALAAALGLGLVLATHGAAFAVDDATAPRVVRAAHDVTLKLKAPKATSGGRVSTKLVVKNRGRTTEQAVTMSIFADVPSGTPLWTETLSVRGHHQKTKNVTVDVPAGTNELIAVADCDDDENPGNNMDGAPVHDADDDHDGDDDEGDDDDEGGSGTVTPPSTAAVLAGAATYATNCASCHGVLGEGGTARKRLVGESAHELLEAMREGEDGMPRFVDMTWQDAQNLAAFLVNPSAATAPPATTPPTTPPTTTPPTTPPTTTPPATTPTYTASVKAIMDSSCVVCHKGTKAPAKIRLDSYSAVSANAAAALSAMQAGRMPPGNPLPASTVQVFADWINGGKPQ